MAHVLLTYQMQCSIFIFSISALVHALLISQACYKTEKAALYRFLDAAPLLLAYGMM
jgi:hypothetical protein